MAKKIIDELVTLIGVNISPGTASAIEKVNAGIASIRKSALLASGALIGFGYAIDRLARSTDASAKFADGIGVGYENLQKLEYAAQKAGASAQDLDSSLLHLTQTLTSLRPGEYNQTLAMLGISARKSNGELKRSDELLLEIADKYKNMSVIRRQQFGAQQGFSSSLVNFLGQGSKKILADMREASAIGAVIPERLKDQAAALFDDSMLKLKATLKATSAVIALSLSPALIKLIDGMQQFIVLNKEAINAGIGSFLKGVAMALSDIGSVLKAIMMPLTATYKVMDGFFSKFPGYKKDLDAMTIVGYAMTTMLTGLAAATLAATWEWVALGAAIVAVIKAIQWYKGMQDDAVDFVKNKIPSNPKNMISDVFSIAGKVNPFNLKNYFPESANQSTTSNDNSRVINNTNNFTINTSANGRELVGLIQQQLDVVSSVQVASPGYNRAKVG